MRHAVFLCGSNQTQQDALKPDLLCYLKHQYFGAMSHMVRVQTHQFSAY